MYGLVNKAIEGLIKKQFGDATWEQVKMKAQFNDIGFLSMKSYPDSVTYNLVNAASDVLNMNSKDLLEAFGEHWVLYTSEEGYGEMMNSAGNSLPEFLGNLNMMHFRLGQIMPEMIMPKFEVSDVTSNSLLLHYQSNRDGLADMVTGLIKGLGKRFNTNCDVEIISAKSKGDNHDIFKVSW